MDLLVLCLAATCVLYVNGDKEKSKTDVYPSTLDIACKQLSTSGCSTHRSWANRCSGKLKSKGLDEDLLKAGNLATPAGDIVLKQHNRNISLHQACKEGRLDVVKYILSQELEDINCRGEWGRTPVMTAAMKGHVKLYEYLVSQGCDLSAVNDHNSNVLHYACIGGNTEIVRKLIVSKKSDIESIGRYGRTPLLYVARHGQREVFDLLLELGCDPLVTDEYKYNILHLASFGGHVHMVRYILSRQFVSIDSRMFMGRTPVHEAASSGNKEVFCLLVENGCDVTTVDNDNYNILHLACAGGRVEMVQLILSLNIVDRESRGKKGETPVLVAAKCGQKAVFDYLVGEGCNIDAVDDENYNILHLASSGGHVEMVLYILSLKAVSEESRGLEGRTAVLTAAINGRKQVFDCLVGQGCNINAVDDQGSNILHLACAGGNVEIVRYILSHNIVSMESINVLGRTPVMVAAESGSKRVFDCLVENGGKVKSVDNDKNNILHLACIGGYVDMVKHLMTLKVVEGMEKIKNKHGRTPKQIAESQGDDAVVNLLKTSV